MNVIDSHQPSFRDIRYTKLQRLFNEPKPNRYVLI